ncbi:MAG: hypothetical protein GX862_05830 [Leucobacter sp.]|nr:hypothetical protein [Leucobacter sp.]
MLTQTKIRQAISDIRAAEATLSRAVQVLRDAGVWSGADADRFEREWNEQVRGQLLRAAGTIESVSYVPFTP